MYAPFGVTLIYCELVGPDKGFSMNFHRSLTSFFTFTSCVISDNIIESTILYHVSDVKL